ncbi:MAG: hypothetical protein ACKO04_07180 [Actinomycetes bacterium]
MVPACMLVVLGLGTVAVDGAVVHAAQRRLLMVCAAAADDAAGMVDARAVQRDGSVRLDEAAARRVATARLAATRRIGASAGPTRIVPDARRGTVDVATTVDVAHLVFRLLPGGAGPTTVSCHVRGRLRP